MPPKKGKKGKKAKEGDDDTKTEQKRIIDEIYKVPSIEEYPVKYVPLSSANFLFAFQSRVSSKTGRNRKYRVLRARAASARN